MAVLQTAVLFMFGSKLTISMFILATKSMGQIYERSGRQILKLLHKITLISYFERKDV